MTEDAWKGEVKEWKKTYPYNTDTSITANITPHEIESDGKIVSWAVSINASENLCWERKGKPPSIRVQTGSIYDDIDVAKEKAEVMAKAVISALNSWNAYITEHKHD